MSPSKEGSKCTEECISADLDKNLLRFLIERSEFISLKKNSGQKGMSLREKILDKSLIAKEYMDAGFGITFSSAYSNDEFVDSGLEFTVRKNQSYCFQVYFVRVQTLLKQWIVAYRYRQLEKLHLDVRTFCSKF
jgi:hypothetical protein